MNPQQIWVCNYCAQLTKQVINIEELYKVLCSVISMTNYQNCSVDDEWRWKVGVCDAITIVDAIVAYMVTLNYNLDILSCRLGGGHRVHFQIGTTFFKSHKFK
jgi:hypothetical protein